MREQVQLRGYRPGDAAAMHAMDEICFTEEFRFDVRAMRRFAEAKGALVAIAERVNLEEPDQQPEMLGFCIVQIEGVARRLRGYVVTLDVAPSARRTGVASLLLEAVERGAGEAGADRMELHVFAGNEGAIRFYESRGYLRLRGVAGFYGRGLDAVVYRRLLAREAAGFK